MWPGIIQPTFPATDYAGIQRVTVALPTGARFRFRLAQTGIGGNVVPWAIKSLYIGSTCVGGCNGRGLCVPSGCICDTGYMVRLFALFACVCMCVYVCVYVSIPPRYSRNTCYSGDLQSVSLRTNHCACVCVCVCVCGAPPSLLSLMLPHVHTVACTGRVLHAERHGDDAASVSLDTHSHSYLHTVACTRRVLHAEWHGDDAAR